MVSRGGEEGAWLQFRQNAVARAPRQWQSVFETRNMDIESIIGAIADEADDFLGSASSMTEARPLIREHLKENYPDLSDEETLQVMAGLFSILSDEGFFDGATPGEAASWNAGEDDSIHEV